MTEDSPSAFAGLLRAYRDAAGLTQQELADQALLGVRTVSDLERGVSRSPYPSTVRRIADALQLPRTDREALQAAARRSRARPGAGGRLSPSDGSPARPTWVLRPGGDQAGQGALLAGRDDEVRRLTAALTRTEHGTGGLLLIEGEAGIGKTRLVQEIAAAALERRFLVVAGRCYPSQQRVPFAPWLEILDQVYDAAPPAVRDELAGQLPHLLRLLPDRYPEVEIAPAAADPQRLRKAVSTFVRRVGADAAMIVVLDDLQAADQASIALLAHLTRRVRNERILLVGTCRGVDVDHAHPLRGALHELNREQLVTTIRPGPLDREATTALVSDRLQSRTAAGPADRGVDELAGLLQARTGGNPFFLVELLRHLTDRFASAESRADDRLAVELEVPQTVREAILARVARLGSPAREVLSVASVLGQGFRHEEMLVVAGLGERDTGDGLDELERSGLLRNVDGEYVFDHALTRDAVYAQHTAARRRRLHRAAGLGLLELGADTQATRSAEIAEHLTAGGAPELAVSYHLLAGERAISLFAYADAERQLRTALELSAADDPVGRARIWERLGAVLTARTRYDEAFAVLEEAATAYQGAADLDGIDRVELLVAAVHFRRGSPAAGAERLEHLLAAARSSASDGTRRPGVVALGAALARLHYANGRYAACRDAATEARRRIGPEHPPSLVAEVELMRGIGLYWSNEPDGLGVLEHAAELAERAGALETWCTVCLPLHLAHVVRGEFDRSEVYGQQGLRLAERTGDTGLAAMHLANLGHGSVHRGDWAVADERLGRAVDLAAETALSYFSPLPSTYLGVLRGLQGRWAEASGLLGTAVTVASDAGNAEVLGYARAKLVQLDVARGLGTRALDRMAEGASALDPTWWYDVLLLTVQAEAQNLRRRPDLAEPLADAALQRALAMGNRVDGVEALRIRAQSLTQQERWDEAAAALMAGMEWATTMRHPYAEARLHDESGVLASARGERDPARKRFEAAADGFARLGAAADLERVRGRLAGLI